MKIFYAVLLNFLILSNTACAGTPVNVKLHVIDDDKQSVSNAKVGMGFLLAKSGNSFDGITDDDGYLETTNVATYGVRISITKNDYYFSGRRTGYGDQDLTLVLRQKKNPIAMYAKKMRLVTSEPLYNTWVGYDFEKGDFLPPYGKGVVKDIETSYDYQKTDGWNYSYRLKVRFPNKGDGLVPFYPVTRDSDFKSDYLAPESGYEQEWKFHKISKGQGTPLDTNKDKNRNYYFRIRTQMDDEGNVASAYYGKLYGEFTEQSFYFNPTENDRNVEFDIRKNLFKNLPFGERINKP